MADGTRTPTGTAGPLRNQYFHSAYGEPEAVNPWDIKDPAATPEAECDYFRHVFLELEASGAVQGLRFVVTSSVDSVPISGDDVVPLVLHDEWARVPHFAPDVLGVLKCYGSRPWFPWRTLVPPSPVSAAAVLNYARVRALGRLHSTRMGGRRPRGLDGRSNDLPVPLGWFKQVDVPWQPFADRPWDAFFVGSVVHDLELGNPVKRSVKRLLGNPKMLSRRALLRVAEDLEGAHPDWQVRLEVSGNFHDVGVDAATSYSQLMMSSRFCLTPRGTSLETFRFFEALRSGTVPICEPLPPWWFYRGSPAPVVRSWKELPSVLEPLLTDPDRQLELHQSCREWWDTRCSPSAVAERIEAWLVHRLRTRPR